MDIRFYRYVLLSCRDQLRASGQGSTFVELSTEGLASTVLPAPGLPEQRAIADYLDTETARIDALISGKQALQALVDTRLRSLIEQRLRSHANSVVPLRRLLLAMPQYGAIESGELENSSWPRYIRITDLRSDGSLRGDGIKCLPPHLAAPFMLRDEDLLFARSGATSGKAFRYRTSMGPACFAGYLIRVDFDPARMLPELVELWTQTAHYWGQVAEATVQATIQNVSAEKFMGFAVPEIPPAEQRSIVAQLRDARERAARVQRQLRHQVELLQEHRLALITAAVTGALEIPGLA